jgi:hypothetical protein
VGGAIRVDEVGRAHGHARAFVRCLLERDVEVQRAAEVDDPERQQQDDRRDDRELGQALRPLGAEVRLERLEPFSHGLRALAAEITLLHGFPWIVKCSL